MKSEGRIPEGRRSPKSEYGKQARCIDSDFGLRPSFGLPGTFAKAFNQEPTVGRGAHSGPQELPILTKQVARFLAG